MTADPSSLKSKGQYIYKVGMGNPHVAINLGMLMNKELNYKGSFRYGVSLKQMHYPLGTFLTNVTAWRLRTRNCARN